MNHANSSQQGTDVLVVGAGVVGLATALAARRAGYSVQVLERAQSAAGGMHEPLAQPGSAAPGPAAGGVSDTPPEPPHGAPDAGAPTSDPATVVGWPATSRVYALAPASVALLQTLDAWPCGLPWFTPGPVRGMAVYERASRGQIALSSEAATDRAAQVDAGSDGQVDTQADARVAAQVDMNVDMQGGPQTDPQTEPQAEAQMASIVGHDALVRALTEACARAGVPIAWGHAITDVMPAGDGAQVVTDDGAHWSGRLVCAADGARSTVRALLGVPIDGASYGQSGVTAVLRLSAPHEGVARQHFREGEVLALLPLADPYAVVLVWSARTAHAETLLELSEPAFLSRLNTALALPGIEARFATDRRSFPLRWLRAERMVSGRVVLLGDAAHVMHPLAGQGLNLGLGDVAEFATAVLPTLGAPGLSRVLGRFERSRKAEAVLYRGTVDSLFRLFNARGLRALRGAGLNLVDHLPPLKRMIVARASGRRIASPEPSNG